MSFTVHTKDSAPAAAKPLLEQVEKGYGFIPNLIATMSEAPPVAEAYLALQNFIAKTSLSPTEHQVAMIETSAINECTYCVAAHSTVSLGKGIDKQVIDALRNGTPIADPKLQALREFTTKLVEQRGAVTEADKQAFLSAGYTPANALEVVLIVITKTLTNYADHIAEPPLDQAFTAQKWQPAAATA